MQVQLNAFHKDSSASYSKTVDQWISEADGAYTLNAPTSETQEKATAGLDI